MLKATLESIVQDDYSEGLDRDIVINIYSMNRNLALLYKDELGFDKDMMKILLAYGYHSTQRNLSSTNFQNPVVTLQAPHIKSAIQKSTAPSKGRLRYQMNE